MKNLLKIAIIFLALSCFSSYSLMPTSKIFERFNLTYDEWFFCEYGTSVWDVIPDITDQFNGPSPAKPKNHHVLIDEYDQCCSELSFFQGLFGGGCDEVCAIETLLEENEYTVWIESYRSVRDILYQGGDSLMEILVAFFSGSEIITIRARRCDY